MLNRSTVAASTVPSMPDELAEGLSSRRVAHDGGGSPGLLVNIRYLLMKQLSKINQYGRFGNS